MRLVPTSIEALAPRSFVLLVGALLGLLRSLPAFLAVHASVSSAQYAQLVLGVAVITFWWTAVRRRQYSVWNTAWQVMFALDGAAILSVVLTRPIAETLMPTPWPTFFATVAGLLLIVSPFALPVAAAVVALGRLLPGTGRPRVASPPIDSSATIVAPDGREA
ncbi:MAG TPA: hypothetical protein VIP11_03230 [Gemmatimonadaceae bacterium]